MGFLDWLFKEETIGPEQPDLTPNEPSPADELKESQKQLGDDYASLSEYLKEKGCSYLDAPEVGDISNMSVSEISEVEGKLSSLREQVDHYLDLGGKPSLLRERGFHEEIRKIEFLASLGYAERQYEFVAMGYSEVVSEISKEDDDLAHMRSELAHSSCAFSPQASNAKASGVEFERTCQALIERMGFDAETTKASGDGGIDIVATSNQPLIAGKYVIQCKRYSGNVGEPIVRDLYGVVSSERANKGVLMTTGTFTASARSFAQGKQLELIDGPAMEKLLIQYGVERQASNLDSIPSDSAMRSFLGYYYEDYEKAKLSEADPLLRHCRQIDALFRGIEMQLIYDNGSVEEMHGCVAVLDSLVEGVLSAALATESRRGRKVFYLALLIRAQYSIWTCNFAKAAACYLKVADEWSEVREDWRGETSPDAGWLAISAISLLNAIGMPIQAEEIRMEFCRWIGAIEQSALELAGIEGLAEHNSAVLGIVHNLREAKTVIHLSSGATVEEATDIVACADPTRELTDGIHYGYNTLAIDVFSDTVRINAGFGEYDSDVTLTSSYSSIQAREEPKFRKGREHALRSPLDLEQRAGRFTSLEGVQADFSDILDYKESIKGLLIQLNNLNGDGSAVFDIDDAKLGEMFDMHLFVYSLWVVGRETSITDEDVDFIKVLTGVELGADGMSMMKEGGENEIVEPGFEDELCPIVVAMKHAFGAVGAEDPSGRIADLYEIIGMTLSRTGETDQCALRAQRADAYCTKVRINLPNA